MHGKMQPGAQVGKIHKRFESFFRISGERGIPGNQQVSVSLFPGASHPSPQLINLGQAQTIRFIDNDGIGRRNIQPRFNNGGANKDVDFPAQESHHGVFKFPWLHLAVGHFKIGLRDQCS